MDNYKNVLKNILKKLGYDIKKTPPIGSDPFKDMAFFLNGIGEPIIFDIGANIGQSVDRIKKAIPRSIIHSFEPSPDSFWELTEHCKKYNNVNTWNCGIGSSEKVLPFFENHSPTFSSFLELGETTGTYIEKVTNVDIITLDSFARANNIDFIDVVKSDTQGFEFEVFKGAEKLMNDNKIGLLYFEFTFSDMYIGLPKFNEVFQFLTEHNFLFVCYYEQRFLNNLISWTDVMFINSEYYKNRKSIG